MNCDLRIAEDDWKKLRKHFAKSFRSAGAPETGALAILGECRTPVKHEFIIAQILLPGPGDLKVATGGALVFDSAFLRRAHLAMREAKLAGIATFHTHPGAESRVGFSLYDDAEDPQLAANLIELEPATRLVSVVVGRNVQCGRVFAEPHSARPLRRLVVVGDQLAYLPLNGNPASPSPTPAAIFDRGLALTGSGALSLLAEMTIAVVGASGTGSLVCELLARAGCRNILLIDHDIMSDINLNRVLHAKAVHARDRVPKVELLRQGIEELGLGCRVEAIQSSILDAGVLRRVLDADLVFGCVDRGLPRHLLCELSARYLLPYIDVGSEIGGDSRGIVSLDSRVNYVASGRHCLTCAGIVTPRQLEFESLTYNERQRKIALGYSDELVLDKPAVMDLNMRAASTGVLVLRHLLQPFLLEPLPVTISHNAVTYTTIGLKAARNFDPACPTCQANRRKGHGDCGPRIGFDVETVRRIMGPDAPVPISPARRTSLDRQHPRAPHFLTRITRSALSTFARPFRRE